MFVVFLSNRVHPDGKGDVTPLRARVATIAASAITDAAGEAARPRLLTGRDFGPSVTAPARTARPPVHDRPRRAARRRAFAPLKGKRVGLVTNHTGRARDGATAIDLLSRGEGCHSWSRSSARSTASAGCSTRRSRPTTDEKTGLPIHSLYGETRAADRGDARRASTRWSIDLQDIGARFYTYMTTMAYVMEEAAKRKHAGRRARPAEPDQRLCRSKVPRSTRRRSASPATSPRCRSGTA